MGEGLIDDTKEEITTDTLKDSALVALEQHWSTLNSFLKTVQAAEVSPSSFSISIYHDTNYTWQVILHYCDSIHHIVIENLKRHFNIMEKHEFGIFDLLNWLTYIKGVLLKILAGFRCVCKELPGVLHTENRYPQLFTDEVKVSINNFTHTCRLLGLTGSSTNKPENPHYTIYYSLLLFGRNYLEIMDNALRSWFLQLQTRKLDKYIVSCSSIVSNVLLCLSKLHQ